MKPKTYHVLLYRAVKPNGHWSCEAVSLAEAAAKFAVSGEDRNYMTAVVKVEGGKTVYRVESFREYHEARRKEVP